MMCHFNQVEQTKRLTFHFIKVNFVIKHAALTFPFSNIFHCFPAILIHWKHFIVYFMLKIIVILLVFFLVCLSIYSNIFILCWHLKWHYYEYEILCMDSCFHVVFFSFCWTTNVHAIFTLVLHFPWKKIPGIPPPMHTNTHTERKGKKPR